MSELVYPIEKNGKYAVPEFEVIRQFDPSITKRATLMTGVIVTGIGLYSLYDLYMRLTGKTPGILGFGLAQVELVSPILILLGFLAIYVCCREVFITYRIILAKSGMIVPLRTYTNKERFIHYRHIKSVHLKIGKDSKLSLSTCDSSVDIDATFNCSKDDITCIYNAMKELPASRWSIRPDELFMEETAAGPDKSPRITFIL
jgi:hypothetical protein